MTLQKWGERFATYLENQAEDRQLWVLACFSVLYLLATLVLAWRRLLWNDELYTFYITRLPTLRDVLGALSTGTEQLPPFFYVVSRCFFALFGANQVSVRLPEVLGFWVMCLCVFRFVARRCSTLCGLVAMLFPLVTPAYYYAYEGRPYGLVLGSSAFSLMSWQSVTLNERRGTWLLSLTVGLAATVSFHYYGALILFPLVLGELLRSVTLKRIDIPVWVAFALGISPLVAFLPLIRQALTQSGSFWSLAHWGAIPTFYSDLLGPAAVPIIAALVAWSAYPASRLSGASSTREPFVARLPGFELAAAFGFILIPVLAVILGKLVTGAFTSRYALPGIIGFSILIAFSAFRLWRSSEPMMVILVLCFCAAFASKVARTWKDLGWDIAKEKDAESFLQSHTGEALPIVVSDAHLFSLLGHYAPPDLAQRLVYLADPGASRRYLGFDSPEQGMVHLLQPWFHWRVEDYEPYIASHQRFLVYGPVGTGGASITNSGYFLNWVLSDLVARHMQVELKARDEEILLFLISPSQPDSR